MVKFQNTSHIDQAFRLPSEQFKTINGRAFLVRDSKCKILRPGEVIEVEEADAPALRRLGHAFVEISE